MIELYILTCLTLKHLVVDFLLQFRYQYANKGTYGHPGGVLHAWLHGMGTLICFYWFDPVLSWYLALADMIIHYHIDWAKVKINKIFGWGPTTHDQFWWLLGVDQFLHMMTYIVLVAIAVK